MDDGSEPVADDEFLYRRIPVSKGWYDEKGLSPEAFYPRPDEETGISIYRAKYITLEKAAQGKSKKGYWVAVLRAGDLRQHGIQVEPRPEPGDAAHAELPDLTCHNRDSAEALKRQQQSRGTHFPANDLIGNTVRCGNARPVAAIFFLDSPKREQVGPSRQEKPVFLEVSMRFNLLTAVEHVG